jgi:ornithine cyclodeaminase
MKIKMTKPVEFLYLSQEDVKAAGGLDMQMVLEAIEKAFILHNQGHVKIPHKIVMDFPPGERERGRINGLAGYIGGDWEAAGIKWVPSFPKNPLERGLPRANAIIILNDTQTGMPLAIMDGTIISAMRTGAMGGIGAKYLAREDSEIVGLIGMGVQNRTQAMAIKQVLPKLKEFRGYDVSMDKAIKGAQDIKELTGIDAIAKDTPQAVVEQADVVVTATVADEPIVKNSWMKKGSLFVHIGSYIEEEFEVVLNSSKIVADDWEVIKHRGTPVLARMFDKGMIKDSDIYGNIDEIIAGKKPGRENDDERIFFAPIGMAHEDIAVASRIYERAKKMGIGQNLRLWNEPMWA